MMTLLFGFLCAGAGVCTGYLIGRCWRSVDYSEGYADGEMSGFSEGFDRGAQLNKPVAHQTPTEKITA